MLTAMDASCHFWHQYADAERFQFNWKGMLGSSCDVLLIFNFLFENNERESARERARARGDRKEINKLRRGQENKDDAAVRPDGDPWIFQSMNSHGRRERPAACLYSFLSYTLDYACKAVFSIKFFTQIFCVEILLI